MEDSTVVAPVAARDVIARLARAARGGVLTVPDAAEALGRTRAEAAAHLARLARRGWLQRARRGLYVVVPLEAPPGERVTVEDPWVMARAMFSPCYIGGWSAAEHWGFTEQVFRSTVVVTSAAVRRADHNALTNRFRLFRSPRAERSAGVAPVWRGPEKVPVSGRERTLVDGFQNPELCGGVRHLAEWMVAYGNSDQRDFRRLLTVARAVASGAAWKRLGFLAEVLWPTQSKLLESARQHLSAGHAKLDPSVARPGRLVTRWRLRINVEIGESGRRGAAP